MSHNNADFTLDLNKFTDSVIPEELVIAHRALSLELLSRIVLRTPVDTGRARYNWQLSIGLAASTTLKWSKKKSGDASAAGEEAINRGLKTLQLLKPFSLVILTNNLPYIERLENGYSMQAPNGMIAVTIQELNESVA